MANKSMMILGIDLEGMNENLVENGVNLAVDRVTEIGAVLWDTRINQPVKIFSELINEPDHLSITEEIQELTGIDDQMLNEWGLQKDEIKLGLERLAIIMKKADYCMAHNGTNYDVPMLSAMFKRFGLEMPNKVWIDTAVDVEFPKKMVHKSMANLEHSHGFINPYPHRAVTDVLSMLKIASNYSFERMAALADSPKVKIIAELEAPNWRNKNEVDTFNKVKSKVSRARFQWNPNNKTWTKSVHRLLIDEGKINYDFDWSLL
jgi:DNA polymerase-3 subunit epsilon